METTGTIVTAIAALFAGLSALLSPVLLSWMTGRRIAQEKADARKDRSNGYAREDVLAARLLKQTAAVTNKLNVIHTLVNSQLSAALKSEFDALVREVAVMKELVDLRREAGSEPSKDTLKVIAANELKITQLASTLADRDKQTEIAASAAGAAAGAEHGAPPIFPDPTTPAV